MCDMNGHMNVVHYYHILDEVEKDKLAEQLKSSNKKSKIEIQRFKGLGEMNPSQLRETVMDPATRQLVNLSITSSFYLC